MTPTAQVRAMKLAVILAALLVLLVACSRPTEPVPELDCEPPGPEAEWCHHLDGDAVRDSLIPLPPDTTGAP
ncbi:MAG: hypothetical protein OEW52_00320 [Thermoleophilia bacterium]|nr:hypothetical protein [Thermoleophilia bacterium]